MIKIIFCTFIKIAIKLLSLLSLRQIANLLFLCCAVYQFIFITLQYTQYKTTISITTGEHVNTTSPSISFCIKGTDLIQLNQLKSVNETIGELINRLIYFKNILGCTNYKLKLE